MSRARRTLQNERRVAERVECEGPAEITVPFPGYLFRGEIANISEVGCHVKTRARLNLRRHAQVELRFTLKGDVFSIVARVVWAKSAAGARFEFTHIEPAAHKMLLRLVEEMRDGSDGERADFARA
jgi:hypothetical protein